MQERVTKLLYPTILIKSSESESTERPVVRCALCRRCRRLLLVCRLPGLDLLPFHVLYLQAVWSPPSALGYRRKCPLCGLSGLPEPVLSLHPHPRRPTLPGSRRAFSNLHGLRTFARGPTPPLTVIEVHSSSSTLLRTKANGGVLVRTRKTERTVANSTAAKVFASSVDMDEPKFLMTAVMWRVNVAPTNRVG